ncbi:hypothetical protein GUJ93_ZPchr0002g26035 [Zizania palustris]|uniref:Uncharacterized protein n=1 Tax=Zizania palustris TaxID=103762 RepID=A0A8J5VUW5_ZIZPA|nr:hypothetical protein GUJ93_ZPchr0002g26035 [Zizania palustris]
MGNSYSSNSGLAAAPELPLHLCFFLVVLLVFLSFSWYMSYEASAGRFADQTRLLLMASPLALLLAVRLLSGAGDGEGRRVDHQLLSLPMPERDTIHRAGGSPWGVGLVLALLLLVVSYRSNFRERWFPLVRKDFYHQTGWPWKCGYLLHGPSGLGKSSLIAAMDNHLRYDVFDLELSRVITNTDNLRVLPI